MNLKGDERITIYASDGPKLGPHVIGYDIKYGRPINIHHEHYIIPHIP